MATGDALSLLPVIGTMVIDSAPPATTTSSPGRRWARRRLHHFLRRRFLLERDRRARAQLVDTLARGQMGPRGLPAGARSAATLAIAALLPMAWIPFYTSMFHFLSAAVTFVALAVAQAADALVQLRILRRGAGQPADGGAGCGGCLEGLGTEARLLLCYNAFFASSGFESGGSPFGAVGVDAPQPIVSALPWWVQ